LNRFHPVLKIARAHLGTDLAAPAGTPIRSVGDGVVVEAGYKGGNGNYVTIRHNSTYTTGYLHMSRIAAGMRSGANVRQGEVIGYVGSTGWATGPHLCYRFWKNGVQVDALKVELPAAEPIRSELKERYQLTMDSVQRRLNGVSLSAGK
jgi:murein DD-endopeptidase MepM/ murein hydrolase activator NlpD